MNKLITCIGLLTALAFTAQAQTDFVQTPKGARYRVITHGNGPKIKLDDIVTFQFTVKTDKDSVLESSYQAGRPAQAQVRASQNAADLMEVFPQLNVNDSVLVRVPSDSLFAGHDDRRPPFFPKGSFLNFTLKVEKVQSMNEAMAERNAAMEKVRAAEATTAAKYIADNKLTPKITASGLKYVVTQASAARKPLAGDTVLVNYTGKLLNGKVFDSSVESVAKASGLAQPGRTYEPISVAVGKGQVIPGWDEGLLLLNEGSKATFIIPSALAYGQRGTPDGTIPPFSTLVFDVELVKVKPALHKAVPFAKPAVKKRATGGKTVKKKVTRK
ncbi:FKBP-type peptidyl-prolyl cis-trans isomerase [Mucilaginibacter sp. Bleaf8]|uniref:FKBP-type peptidyl-prolyl cis-trans isomerase n=1 Tax=Mucilaginibacter sp. Bleaf8 TaxID=2834430 RepID=UPI001BCD0000|nr:FKBP-type peptidyl-prolyl cis-trans isomerase [Mucilaginibacter sp. Bleaf8]MBS7566528.1 FKBP-type peptidyl-prolyl cis-trans isomerase [Mucilaginibacter sp. Bleaf8]